MEAKDVNRLYHAVLWKDGEPIEVHHLTMEPTVKHSRYRAVSSMNWFNEREGKILVDRMEKRKPNRFHSNIKCDQDHQLDLKWERSAYAPDPALTETLPQFTHTSIWDFYKAIGYDYKAKKYVRAD